MQKFLIIKCLFFMWLLSFCATVNAAKDNFYSEDKPNIIVTKADSQFTIKLKSNPTTGYRWFLTDYNSRLILPLKHHFEVPQSKLIGAPGFEVWTFRVKPDAFSVPHQTRIRFTYTRPWDKNDNATQVVFNVTTESK